jgi:hypothetical protein
MGTSARTIPTRYAVAAIGEAAHCGLPTSCQRTHICFLETSVLSPRLAEFAHERSAKDFDTPRDYQCADGAVTKSDAPSSELWLTTLETWTTTYHDVARR